MLESFHPWHFLCSVSFVSARTEALRVISQKINSSKRYLCSLPVCNRAEDISLIAF
jgi:hypothetical protein